MIGNHFRNSWSMREFQLPWAIHVHRRNNDVFNGNGAYNLIGFNYTKWIRKQIYFVFCTFFLRCFGPLAELLIISFVLTITLTHCRLRSTVNLVLWRCFFSKFIKFVISKLNRNFGSNNEKLLAQKWNWSCTRRFDSDEITQE